MNGIAEKYGIKHVQAMREAGKQTWYEWPSPESLIRWFSHLKFIFMKGLNKYAKIFDRR